MVYRGRMLLAVVVAVAFFCAPSAHSGVTVIATLGKVYPFGERDGAEQIKDLAKKIDWNKYYGKDVMKERALNYKPKNLSLMPRVTEDRVRLVDMTWVLDHDIMDNNQKLLHPKGSKVNPLDYLQVRRVLVFLDATDPEQVEWFQLSKYSKDTNVMLCLTNGRWKDVQDALKRRVYYATPLMVSRLDLLRVPSVAYQRTTDEYRMMAVHEIDVSKALPALRIEAAAAASTN